MLITAAACDFSSSSPSPRPHTSTHILHAIPHAVHFAHDDARELLFTHYPCLSQLSIICVHHTHSYTQIYNLTAPRNETTKKVWLMLLAANEKARASLFLREQLHEYERSMKAVLIRETRKPSPDNACVWRWVGCVLCSLCEHFFTRASSTVSPSLLSALVIVVGLNDLPCLLFGNV